VGPWPGVGGSPSARPGGSVSGLAFLLAALGLSVVGSLVLWLRQRQPTSFDQGIEDFSREMQALAPPTLPPPPGTDKRRG
jgi:hypothetical protein